MMRRILHASGTVLLAALILLCIPFTLPRFFGFQIYEVITESMAPEYPVGSVIYVRAVEPDVIKAGDVITFSIGTETSQVMTHRVTAVNTLEETFTTKGDANASEDISPVSFRRLVGVPVYTIPHMGSLTQLFMRMEGRIFLGCLLVLVFLLWFAADHIEPAQKKKEPIKTEEKRSGFGQAWMLLAGVLLIVFAGWNLYRISQDYGASDDLYTALNADYLTESKELQNSGGESSEAERWQDLVRVDLASLKELNPDVAGWLYFENESISYPLMYSGDDSTYLHTAADGSAASAGSIFIEGGNHSDLSDCHTIIYGHNMRNLSMFGKLRYYKNDPDYYSDHAFFQIHTMQGIYRYKIFAYAQVPADSFVYQAPYAPDEAFGAFIEQLYAQSLRDTGVDATQEDHIVTLSTCAKTGQRLVVHGVRVDYCSLGE